MVEEMRKTYPEYERIKLPVSKKIFAKSMDLLLESKQTNKAVGKK